MKRRLYLAAKAKALNDNPRFRPSIRPVSESPHLFYIASINPPLSDLSAIASRPPQQWGRQLTPEPSLCRHILVSPKKITSRMRCGSSRRSHSLKRELECKSRGSTRVSQQSAASMHDCGILLARGLECMRKTISSPLFCLT